MALDDVDVKEQVEKVHAVITANTFEFSDKCIHLPGKEVKTEYSGLEKQFRIDKLKVFANGRAETDEGYVSITFHYATECFIRIGCCIISIIDVYGNQRFTETFSFFKEHLLSVDSPHSFNIDSYISKERLLSEPEGLPHSFNIDRYISRERLLSESDELLPNDVLTLLIDVYFTVHMYSTISKPPALSNYTISLFESCFQYDEARQPTKLLLDSPLAECLTKESFVFQKMIEYPMVEKRTKVMNFDKKDFRAFKHIGEILMKKRNLKFTSIRDIFDVYIVADRYCIPAVIETCTAFLKLCLFDHTVDEYFEIANEYKAEGLKELLVKEINLVKQTDLKAVIEKFKDGAVLKRPIRRCLWRYSHYQKDYPLIFRNPLVFIRTGSSSVLYGEEKFDFYK